MIFHLPIVFVFLFSITLTVNNERAVTYFEVYVKDIAEIGKHRPVLVHCRTGERACK